MSERKTILVVDDSSTGRKELCDILGSEYDLIEAANGSEALSLLRQYKESIELVILDLYMPKMDGYEVLSIIRSDDDIADIPVIAVSSDEQVNGEIRALEMGADDFIIKPYDARVLFLRVHGILRGSAGSAAHSTSAAKAWAYSTIEDMMSGIGIFELSVGKLMPIFLSDLFYAVFGRETNIARDYNDDFFSIVDLEDVAALRSRFETAVTADINIFCEFKARRSDDSDIWIRMQAVKIPYPDRKGVVFQCHFLDITALRSNISSKKSYAVYDSLTEIYGRFSFIDVVRSRLQTANDKNHILIRINIDRFKAVNEVFGSETGDEVLCGIAEILRGTLFSIGDFGRLESDNFVVCFSMKVLDPMRFIDMLNEKVKARFPEYNIVLSYGLYMINDVNTPVEVMFDRAKMALRSIKNSYITCFAIYNDSMLREVVEEHEIVGEMENAIETEQFTFFLQPVIDARSRVVVGAEALARWIHPEKGMIVPGRFIPIFEENGFIVKLDHYIWEKVCQLIAKWKANGEKVIPVSVNVSRTNMFNPMLCEQLLALVEKYGLEPKLLKLEITESAYTESPQQLKDSIELLRENGFIVMMDDFGSGYSSLNMLKDISVDVLKIDSKFMVDFESNERSSRVLTSVVRMASWLDIPVVAEGVETQAQLDFMQSIGCESMQGYYFSPPVPVEEFEKLKNRAFSPAFSQEKKKLGDLDYHILFDPGIQTFKLFDGVAGGIGIYEFYGDRLELIRANDSYYDMLGHKYPDRSDLDGKRFTILQIDEERPIFTCANMAVNSQKAEKVSMRRFNDNGEPFWTEISMRCIGSHKDADILTFSLSDISERKNAQHDAIKQRLSREFDCRYNEILLLDPENRSFERVETGREMLRCVPQSAYYYRDALTGISEGDVYSEDRRQFDELVSSEALNKEHFSGDGKRSVGLRFAAFGAKPKWYRVDLCYDEEYAVFVLGITDESNQKNNDMALLNNAAVFDGAEDNYAILNEIPIGIAIYEVGEKVKTLYVNDTLLELYGYTREQYDSELAKNALEVLDDEQRSALVSEIDRAIVSTGTIETTLKAFRRDKSRLWVQLIGRAQLTADKKVLGFTIQRDFTADMRVKLRNRSRAESLSVLLEDSDAVLFEYDCESNVMQYSVRDPNGQRKYFNMSEYLSGLEHSKVIHPEYRELLKNRIAGVSANEERGEFQFMADFGSGSFIWYSAHFVCVRDDDGNIYRIVGRLIDIDEQKQTQFKLKDESEYRNVVSAKALLVYEANLTNSETKLFNVDESFRERFMSTDKYIRIDLYPDMIHAEDVAAVRYHFSYENFYSNFSAQKTELSCKYRVRTRDSDWVWVETSSHIFRAASGELRRISYMVLIDDEVRMSSELLERAKRDGLSGLLNRNTVEEQIRSALIAGSEHALIIIDIDSFKSYNDNYGHMIGDTVITDVGNAIRNSFRGSDIMGRLGGDEFVVLLSGSMSENVIREKLDRLSMRITLINSDTPERPPITVSGGVAVAPQDGCDFDVLYNKADKALYYAKENGRSRIAFYSEVVAAQ